MARPSKYPPELRERAVRLVFGVQGRVPAVSSRRSGRSRRSWGSARRRRCASGCGRPRSTAAVRPGKTSEEIAEIRELKKENRRAAAGQRDPEVGLGFLRGGARPPTPVLSRLHRRAPRGVRGRADLPRAHRARRARSPRPPTTRPGTGGRRSGRCAMPRSSTLIAERPGSSGSVPVRCPQDVAAPARAGPRRGPVHRGAADAAAGLGRGAAGQEGPHHDPGLARRRGPADLVDRDFTATAPEPAVGRRLHLRRDLVRHRLRRVRLRRLLPPDRGLAGSHHDDHRPGPRHPRDGDLDPRPRRRRAT